MRKRNLMKLSSKIINILKVAASLGSNITENKLLADQSSPLNESFRYMTHPASAILQMHPKTFRDFSRDMISLFEEINKETKKYYGEGTDEKTKAEAAKRLQELNAKGFELLKHYKVSPHQFGTYLNAIRNPHEYFKRVFLYGERPDELDWTERSR
jgi:hypothetical protein